METLPWISLDVEAFAATAVAVSCPLFWYLAVRPMSDLPGLALALASQACLLLAWRRQSPGPDGDRRLSPALTAASGRMIVVGALLAALSIGMRSQTVWFTVPLLVLVLFDRVGRGVAGAMIGGGIMFVVGGLVWGVPLLVASGGLEAVSRRARLAGGRRFRRRRNAVSQSQRAVGGVCAAADVRPSVGFAGARQLSCSRWRPLVSRISLWRDRRTLLAVIGDERAVPRLPPRVPGHLVRPLRAAALSRPSRSSPCVAPPVATEQAVPVAAAAISIWSVAIASPVLVAYVAEPSPTVRVVESMKAEQRRSTPGALAMHQTFKRPLEAEDLAFKAAVAGAAAAGMARAGEVSGSDGNTRADSGFWPIRCAATLR